MKKEHGLAWYEFDRNDRIVRKEKFFKTWKALKRFEEKVQDKDNFWEIIGYSI